MKPRKNSALLFVLLCCLAGPTAHAQQSNIVVTVTGPQESNVVSRIERFDPNTNRTNVTTKTKFYQHGRLVEEKTERKGATDLTALRIYHEERLVMFQAWDSKSDVTQRTFLRDGKAVASEISSKSGKAPDLILFHGKDEGIVAALKRDQNGEMKPLGADELAEVQRGSKAGADFMNELSSEVRMKNHSK